jgi:hypothetical protein
VTITLNMYVCLSFHSHETSQPSLDGFFMKFLHLSTVWKYVKTIQVQLKSYNNNGYFMWRPMYIYGKFFAKFFLEWEMFHTKVVKKIKTHILCSITFFQISCCSWYVEEHGIARQATDNMTCALRMLDKSDCTHSKYVILIAFRQQ